MRCTIATAGLALCLAGAGTTVAGAGSTAQPRPVTAPASHPITPVALAFPTIADGWVLARRGSRGAEVVATDDAGATWVSQWTGRLRPQQMLATDPDHAWVLGQQCAGETCGSVLIGTSDGGAHWSVLAPLTLFTSPPLILHVSQVAFASSTLGVAAARDAACRSRGGLPPPGCTGWVLLTDDGGQSWRWVVKSPEPIVAVAAGAGGLWALSATPGGDKPGVGRYPASFVLLSIGDQGWSWRVRGAIHPLVSASLDPDMQLFVSRGGRVWVSAFDRQSCAMHGCGLDGLWSSDDSGAHWDEVNLPHPFERGVGVPCAYGGPIVLSAGTAAVAFDGQDCTGPASALYRLSGGRATVVHRWRAFEPAALAWPTGTVAYALDQQSVRRTTDGGRTWHRLNVER